MLLGVVTVGLLLTAAPLAGGVGSNPLSGHAGQLRDELEVEGLDYAREEELEGLEEFGYDNGIGVVEDIEDKEERAPHDDVAQAMSPEEAKEFFTLENVAFSPTQLTLGDEEGGKVLFRGAFMGTTFSAFAAADSHMFCQLHSARSLRHREARFGGRNRRSAIAVPLTSKQPDA